MNEKEFIKSVGKAIARQRNLAGLTQSQLAERLDVERETVSRLETGAISPTLQKLYQLSNILNCQAKHFFQDENGEERTQADTIADIIRNLPEERREMVVRFVAEVARVLK